MNSRCPTCGTPIPSIAEVLDRARRTGIPVSPHVIVDSVVKTADGTIYCSLLCVPIGTAIRELRR